MLRKVVVLWALGAISLLLLLVVHSWLLVVWAEIVWTIDMTLLTWAHHRSTRVRKEKYESHRENKSR